MDITQKECRGVLFYACGGFGPGVAHGFSTRLGGVSPAPWDSLNLGANQGDAPERVAENFSRFLAAVGAVGVLVKNKQVHGDRVRPVTEADGVPELSLPGTEEADGLMTDRPGVCLAAFSADCIPVLLYDKRRRVIAAVHAGWRGTALGIAARAVERMGEVYGSRGEDILAAIGPGIGPCCFETHADVPQGLEAGLVPDAAPYIHPLPGGEKYRVDLKGANRRWLLRAGLQPGHIALCPDCTACRGDRFWSHRRLGTERGSMAAVIELREGTA